MNKISSWAAIAVVSPEALWAAQPATMGWPEVIADLTKERTQAETCVGMIKSSKNSDAIASAKTTYGAAKAEMDGVIAGLTTALVEGGKPDSLPTVRASLETSGKVSNRFATRRTRRRCPTPRACGTAAVEPVVKAISDGVGALWTRHVEKDKLELETKKAQLEAAKWPDFGDIAAR